MVPENPLDPPACGSWLSEYRSVTNSPDLEERYTVFFLSAILTILFVAVPGKWLDRESILMPPGGFSRAPRCPGRDASASLSDHDSSHTVNGQLTNKQKKAPRRVAGGESVGLSPFPVECMTRWRTVTT